MTYVKICGIRTVLDAQRCVAAGADAIGLNFYPESPRFVDLDRAQAIAGAVEGQIALVGLFVNAAESHVARIRDLVKLTWVQFHGDESPDVVARFLPAAYRAIRVQGSGLADEVRRFSGELVLVDAYVPGMPGGTGATFDWSLAVPVARERKVLLAGGLHPGNVSAAIRAVQPFGVDVASGVESSPGVKDPRLVERFVEQAKQRFQSAPPHEGP
jgi:phosphoribosylanthranilate isomerase